MNILCDSEKCRAKCRRHVSRLADLESRICTSDLSGGDWRKCEHLPTVSADEGNAPMIVCGAVVAALLLLVGFNASLGVVACGLAGAGLLSYAGYLITRRH